MDHNYFPLPASHLLYLCYLYSVKKLFLSILTLMYMMMSSGIAMDIHYCMGKRAGVDFYSTGNDKCRRCGMKEKKSGCCHDELQFHKLEDSHKNVYNNISFDAAELAIVTEYPIYDWQLITGHVNNVDQNNSPPGKAGRSCCILNCVFRL